MNKIGVGYASVTDLEKRYVLEALDNQRLSSGKFVSRFEKEFSKLHGHSYGVMCNSGTCALELALATLKETENWDSNTEVLVPAITFIATSNAVIHLGMKPVFVDVEMDSYNMNPDEIEKHITPNTRCIIPVHCFGLPCDMARICKIAKEYNLKIIEDCAEAHFAKINGNTVGSFSDIMACSTYVAHTITTGIGGIACTSNAIYAEVLRSLVAHGRSCTCERCVASDGKNVCKKRLQSDLDKRFTFERLGFSYRVGELEGALGVAQIERRDEIMNARHHNAEKLIEGLSDLSDCLQLPVIPCRLGNVEHTYMMFPILVKNVSKINRNTIVRYLEDKNIETRPMLPLLNQPIYKKIFGNIEDAYPCAKYIDNNGFYIGCHHGINDEDIKYIISEIHNCLKEYE